MVAATSMRPVFSVSDMDHSLDFYTAALGFIVQQRGTAPWRDGAGLAVDWVELRRDAVTLALYDRRVHPVPVGPSMSVVFVDDIDGVERDLRGRNAVLDGPARDNPSGPYRDFSVQDPDGNRIVFSQALA